MAVDSFWKRWKRDVFPTLVPRRKWRIEQNVRIDDVVTVTDENAVGGSWTMGRIVHVFPGADGKVGNVKVKKAKGVYSLPVTKIAVIYPAEGYNYSGLGDKDCALIGVEDVSLTEPQINS